MMKSNRPSPTLILFLLFPVLGLLAAGVVMLTNTSLATGGTPPTPLPVTLPPAPITEDAPVINFTLTSLDGETVSLTDYAGRIVFLNFWATWCVPCREELPAFQAFQALQPPDGAIILAVNVQESPDQIREFLDQYGGRDLTVLLDSEGSAKDSYGIFNLPTTFVIDAEGIVNYVKYGEMTVDDLNAYVTAVSAAA